MVTNARHVASAREEQDGRPSSATAHGAIGDGATFNAGMESSEYRRMRAGEFVHYQANFLKLFQHERSPAEVDDIARAAIALRQRRIDEFDERLRDVRAFFDGSNGDVRMAPYLGGWDVERIRALRRDHGGVLLAAFHYGDHRHVLTDLCCLGVPFVAPVAKQSYFDAPAAFSKGPADCADAPLLLEVEGRNVGKRLVSGLRGGRCGLIYVDGNMGPDGHLVEESGVEVAFLGHRIRVKSGIARLAMALRLPVLLVMSEPTPRTRGAGCLSSMTEILPAHGPRAGASPAAEGTRIMQACYDALAASVAKSPEDWEFAFCLHRWLCADPAAPAEPEPASTTLSDAQLISIDPATVLSYARDDGTFWLHVGRQRAYRIPDWGSELYPLLRNKPMAHGELVTLLKRRARSSTDPAVLLDLLHTLNLIRVVA